MEMFVYKDLDTFYHRLDPRVKLAFLLISVLLLLTLNSFCFVLFLSSLIILLIILTGSLSNLKPVWFILLLIFIFSTFLWGVKGEKDWYIFNVEGISKGILTGIKIDMIMLSGILYLSTTRNEEITLSLLKLRVPYPFSFAFSTALRLLPAFIGTGFTILKAQRARGLELRGGGIISRLKKYIPLLAPLFLITLRKTDLMAMALESKGFGSGRRTFYLELKMKRKDWLSLAGVLLLLTLLYWEHYIFE